jgi:S1-C subfamily serine protease
MSDLATVHLKQGRSFLRAGDSRKAIELLEKARVLSRTNKDLHCRILEELASACEAAGLSSDAARWRDQARRLGPPPAPARSANPYGQPIYASAPSSSQTPQWAIFLIATMLVLVIAGVAVFAFTLHSRSEAERVAADSANAAPVVVPTPMVQPASPPPAKPTPATRPAPVPPPVVKAAPVFAEAPKPKSGAWDRQQLFKDDVGLIVVVLEYKGPIGNREAQIDIPLGSGTAFAIDSSGLMLTNRHVTDADKEPGIPATLESANMPTVTLRGTSYVVCFGSDPKDRYVAKVLHRSENFDLSVLHIDREFHHPLPVAPKLTRQGDDIVVCGFPGAVMAALNRANATPTKIVSVTRKWDSSRKIGAFDEFSADSFNSTLTKGIVSAPERNVKGVSYVQIDAVISPGNSGGPVLNGDNEVIGIATWGLRGASGATASYNFALSLPQTHDELEPYMSQGKAATFGGSADPP